MNIVLVLRILVLICSFQAFAIDYYNERDKFHKCYFSQVLADGFGTATDFSFKDKFEAIKDFREKIKEFPEDPGINEFDACGMAPLHYLSMSRVYNIFDAIYIKKICNIFIELGADINLPNRYGVTPLRFAANYGNYAVVETFLEKGRLKRDFSIIELLFSPESYSNDQYYREVDLFGKIEIWKSLKKSWFIDFDPDKLKYIDFRTKEIVKWIGISPKTEFELNSKERSIKTHLKDIHEALTKNTLKKESEKTWNFIKQSANETDNETKTEEN